MADLLIESTSGRELFSWQQSNMVKADQVRKAYISALRDADKGDISSLIEFARN
jgi:hypothetical protein